MTTEKKTYVLKRYGHHFKIAQHGTTVVARLLVDGEHLEKGDKFVGVAILKAPDEFNFQLGKAIAMKSAINKYHNTMSSRFYQTLRVFTGPLRTANDQIQAEISRLRGETE